MTFENINDPDESLSLLYHKLTQCILRSGKKIEGNSLLFTFMKMSSNDTYKIIDNSSIKFPPDVKLAISELESKGLIKKPEDIEKCEESVITSKGIWKIETEQKNLRIEDILTYLQETKLNFSKVNQSFADNEKIIILSFIAVRIFSLETPMDLNSPQLCEQWQSIILKIINYLVSKDAIKIGSSKLINVGYEDPISSMLRHANSLPKKTKNLFCSTRKKLYFLNINTKNPTISTYEIAFLLKKIFPVINSMDEVTEIYTLLCNIAHNESLYVIPNFNFITREWDNIVSEALEQIYLGLNSLE